MASKRQTVDQHAWPNIISLEPIVSQPFYCLSLCSCTFHLHFLDTSLMAPKYSWGLGSAVIFPSVVTIWCVLEPKRAALVATVFAAFSKDKYNFCTTRNTFYGSISTQRMLFPTPLSKLAQLKLIFGIGLDPYCAWIGDTSDSRLTV